ncbi:hypothetical protein [Minwuia sp.]|uniref:hypothetical protein n=1 Tax=Minwuia sp. TaxID=2493630 RepID=UPI003A93EF98
MPAADERLTAIWVEVIGQIRRHEDGIDRLLVRTLREMMDAKESPSFLQKGPVRRKVAQHPDAEARQTYARLDDLELDRLRVEVFDLTSSRMAGLGTAEKHAVINGSEALLRAYFDKVFEKVGAIDRRILDPGTETDGANVGAVFSGLQLKTSVLDQATALRAAIGPPPPDQRYLNRALESLKGQFAALL